jgi:fermentation-respiration switch protein FrsA (DUF1100 family)
MLFRWFEHSQIFHPTRRHRAKPEQIDWPYEEVFLGDKPKIHGWFFPARADSPRKHLAFLVCHGNAGNMSDRLGLTEILLQTGVSVFLFDYRGYGLSTGRPNEEGTYRDAQIAHAWLATKGITGKNIIAFGESLGGAIATELALREPLGGLVLQSTFTCMPDLGCEVFRWLPVRAICSVHYNTVGKLPRVKIPVLVIHSRPDALIGYHHAEKNFAAANEPKLFWEVQGGHCDAVAVDRKNLLAGVEKFLPLVEKQITPLTK